MLSPGSGSQFPLERRVPAFTVQASSDSYRAVHAIRAEPSLADVPLGQIVKRLSLSISCLFHPRQSAEPSGSQPRVVGNDQPSPPPRAMAAPFDGSRRRPRPTAGRNADPPSTTRAPQSKMLPDISCRNLWAIRSLPAVSPNSHSCGRILVSRNFGRRRRFDYWIHGSGRRTWSAVICLR